MATNLIIAAAAGAAAAGAAAAGAAGVNITIVLAVFTICVTTMTTIIKLFSPKHKINEENLRNSPYLKLLEEHVEEKEAKITVIKDMITKQNLELVELKSESKHGTKSLEDLRENNKDLVQRLDDLLKYFLDYIEKG